MHLFIFCLLCADAIGFFATVHSSNLHSIFSSCFFYSIECMCLLRSHDVNVFRQFNFNRYIHSVASHCKAVNALLKQWENAKQSPIVLVENKESGKNRLKHEMVHLNHRHVTILCYNKISFDRFERIHSNHNQTYSVRIRGNANYPIPKYNTLENRQSRLQVMVSLRKAYAKRLQIHFKITFRISQLLILCMH